MPKSTNVSSERKADAKHLRERLKDRPSIEQVLTPDELADATPFYFVLRSFARGKERGHG